MHAVYCCVRNYEFREECKRKQEATSRNINVRQQTEQVEQNRKRKWSLSTIAEQESKSDDAIVVKKSDVHLVEFLGFVLRKKKARNSIRKNLHNLSIVE